MLIRILSIVSILATLIGVSRTPAGASAGPFTPPFTRPWAGPHASPRFHLAAVAPPAPRPVPVQAAVALCRAQPAARKRLSIRGWFVPSIEAFGYVTGGLFDSPQAVPAGVENRWDLYGRWKRYGALYAHISTQASFGARWLKLHGWLDCATFRFRSDRDPFPPAQLKPLYTLAEHGPGAPATTSATAGGLQLTLSIPRRTYPRNALILVRVTIRNVSHHEVGYWTPGVAPVGFAVPQAEVLNGSGQVVFPPAMQFMPPLPGPPPFLQPMRPGQTVSQQEYVVLRGARLRGAQRFLPHLPHGVQRAANTLVTLPIRLHLYSAAAPRLSPQTTSDGLALEVTGPHPRGRPLVLDYADCGAPVNFSYSYAWVRSPLHVTPGCGPVLAWHVRVAWLNHPVAAFDYVAPPITPTPSPVPTATTTSPVLGARSAE